MRGSWSILVVGLLVSGLAQADRGFDDPRFETDSAFHAGYRLDFGAANAPANHRLSAGFRFSNESGVMDSEAVALSLTRNQPRQWFVYGVPLDTMAQMARRHDEGEGPGWLYPTLLLGGVFIVSSVVAFEADDD